MGETHGDIIYPIPRDLWLAYIIIKSTMHLETFRLNLSSLSFVIRLNLTILVPFWFIFTSYTFISQSKRLSRVISKMLPLLTMLTIRTTLAPTQTFTLFPPPGWPSLSYPANRSPSRRWWGFWVKFLFAVQRNQDTSVITHQMFICRQLRSLIKIME